MGHGELGLGLHPDGRPRMHDIFLSMREARSPTAPRRADAMLEHKTGKPHQNGRTERVGCWT